MRNYDAYAVLAYRINVEADSADEAKDKLELRVADLRRLGVGIRSLRVLDIVVENKGPVKP